MLQIIANPCRPRQFDLGMLPEHLSINILVLGGQHHRPIGMNGHQLEFPSTIFGQGVKFTRQIEVLRVAQLKDLDVLHIACFARITPSAHIVYTQGFHIVLQGDVSGFLIEGLTMLLNPLVFPVQDLLGIVDNL